MTYIAHKAENGSIQTVKEHSEQTAALAAAFAIPAFKDIAYQTGLLHDVGKYQPSFQKRISGNDAIRIEHAACGAHAVEALYGKTPMSFMMALCIMGHHSGLPDCGSSDDTEYAVTFYGRMHRETEDYGIYRDELPLAPVSDDPLIRLLKEDCTSRQELTERYAFFTRYCFSCLTDADSVDSMAASGVPIPQKLSSDFAAMLSLLDEKLSSFSCTTALQKARALLQKQAFDNIGADANVYLMNMPTGSGKTLAGMKCALTRALKKRKKHIIYVIPYNSIIDQTVDTFEKVFGETADILRHQSSFSYEDLPDKDEDYKENVKRVCENWDADVIVTTAVTFFESVYGNRRGKLRKLHNMANSILVFDEAHLMPVPYLQPCLRAVSYLTRFFDSEAIFLTATMPDFGALIERYALKGIAVRDLVPDKTVFSAFKKNRYTVLGETSDEDLLKRASTYTSSLIVVNSRAAARSLFASATGEKYHLSTYMTASDRSRVIARIREALAALNKDFPLAKDVPDSRRIVVISTSLIEAGVDLDFEAAFRETAGLDNVLQTGGRCNREGLRTNGDVFLFDRSDGAKTSRTEQSILRGVTAEYEDISSEDAIRAYYERLYAAKQDEITAHSLGNMADNIQTIPFRQYVVKLIDDSRTASVMVPLDEEGQALVRTLKTTGYADIRKMQKYCCTVYEKELAELMRQHVVDDFGTGAYILTNPDYYDHETGILFEGQDIFF